MKKLLLCLLSFTFLSFLPFTANAGHYVVKCYRPCEDCRKICKKTWVEERRFHYDHRDNRREYREYHRDHDRHYHHHHRR